ncbi:MAG: tRNA preQ1(34) S-adenosylmethionine ribosyltransferase-isomerase QueA [Spirochaetes bacterium GWD1_61_31]|nr:MAG: tRNA preQ1(34) S-adenosylmethionine ribosyltransferase-isomerase QueA [Spirochaetes bacterium GWB1_60_80]OHD35091.1 MAG: tRNA preQ1(34) S-adenosylmethionine ribosyltransferase-isomerase QueA [Spirochaetes bacterium GWC1_61_12]OHD43608.1 MAG: tRNA preQ1(34) S-adenosylmethionine ribosyltransferase-isomerase QueA [Spirochaetes bacterium GWD1_61_31]OHD44100.1 MAG: tRNA preQ1(34) S-adenosylmethionine ribosyltransferase-isomerase QueA [Spirochaetes bacterium GWE1_60_18]OHD61859.1 MAG: tRNA pr
MKLSDFRFDLPEELIAQEPPTERGASRLLVLDRAGDAYHHATVARLAEFLPAGTVMVFNDSKVRRARLFASSERGGRVEVLLLRPEVDGLWSVLTSRLAKQTVGKVLHLPEGLELEIVAARPDERLVRFSRPIDDAYLERHGHLPLPPYIRRADRPADAERYQTVYARATGSAAAPTAGLHFTPQLLASLDAVGIERHFVTLHVGLGTFMPVRTDNILEHRMHEEQYSISPEAAAAVNQARAEGRPVLAVGTTSLRTLESAWVDDADGPGGAVRSGDGSTRIFMYPGYRIKSADLLFTNFHTPESTLLMLVSAFAGRERILEAYRLAVAERYRFFSYGDAMLIK